MDELWENPQELLKNVTFFEEKYRAEQDPKRKAQLREILKRVNEKAAEFSLPE